MKPVIVILLGCYSPGYDSTGPNISTKAMCQALAHQFDFKIIASNKKPSGEIVSDPPMKWIDQGFAELLYLPVNRFGAKNLIALLRTIKFSVLIVNGFFDREFTIPTLIGRRFGVIPESTLVLTPRGELTKGALSLKPLRKNVFRFFAYLFQLHRNVILHATSSYEVLDCKRALPRNLVVFVPNCRSLPVLPDHQERSVDEPLRLVFLGRITAVKRLDFALEILGTVKVPVVFNIVGPIGDYDYKVKCDNLVLKLPKNISVNWLGEVKNSEVSALFARHEALFLPSLSENFGHAIFESLSSGTPVIVGDRTPWTGLEMSQAGFDIPISERDQFVSVIHRLFHMTSKEYQDWRWGARRVAEEFVRKSEASKKMSEFLQKVVDEATMQARDKGLLEQTTLSD